MDGKLQAYDLLRDAYLELALLKLDDDHHLMSSSHRQYEIFTFDACPWKDT